MNLLPRLFNGLFAEVNGFELKLCFYKPSQYTNPCMTEASLSKQILDFKLGEQKIFDFPAGLSKEHRAIVHKICEEVRMKNDFDFDFNFNFDLYVFLNGEKINSCEKIYQ